MQRSPIQSFESYLAKCQEKHRASIDQVRKVILKNLPPGYVETVRQKMILYEVPLAVYPDTYNKHPLCYLALASQKSYITLHVVSAYGDARLLQRLQDGFRAAGKKLNMGKGCINFQRADDLALDTIGDVIAAVPMEKYVAFTKAVHEKRSKKKK